MKAIYLITLLTQSLFASVEFIPLGFAPDVYHNTSYASALSKDGQVACVTSNADGHNYKTFIWKDNHKTKIGIDKDWFISYDGSIIIGKNSKELPTIWNGSSAVPFWDQTGGSDMAISGLSPDGSTIYFNYNTYFINIETYALTGNSYTLLESVSRFIGPYKYSSNRVYALGGSLNTPTYVLYPDDSKVTLPRINANSNITIVYISDTGRMIVGQEMTNIPTNTLYGTIWESNDTDRVWSINRINSFRWFFDLDATESLFVGELHPTEIGGKLTAGIYRKSFDEGIYVGELLNDEYEFRVSDWKLIRITAVSANGLIMIGDGLNASGKPEAFMIRLPYPVPQYPKIASRNGLPYKQQFFNGSSLINTNWVYNSNAGFFYVGSYPYLYSWDTNKWYYIFADSETTEDGCFIYSFTDNIFGWLMQSAYPNYYSLDSTTYGALLEL